MRRTCALVLCFLASFLFFLPQAHAEFYRWVDNDGKEFFSNDAKQVPPEYRSRATIVRPDDERVSVSNRAGVPARTVAASGEHRDKNGRGEDYWRRRAQNLRLTLRKQQDEYDLVVQQIEEQDQRPAKNSRSKKRSPGLDRKKLKLEKEIAQTTRMLEVDLADEARRADAYPGWLRE